MRTSSASHGDGARARAMWEMERGREGVARLRSLLMGSRPGDSAAEELVEEVQSSIAAAIAALGSGDGGGGSVCSGDLRSEVSTGKRKGSPGIGNDRRGGCPRRSQNSPRREVMSKTDEDGQTWRKYGRKEIQNCTYPRSYYRCTHKYDQKCMATRQVQRSENDHTSFIITYIGEHTCRDPSPIPQILETHLSGDSYIISFEPNHNHTIEYPKSEAAIKPASALKQECDEDVLSSPTSAASSQAECSLLADQLLVTGGGGGGGGGGGSEKPFAGTAATPNDGDVTSELDLSFDFTLMDDAVFQYIYGLTP